MGFSVAHRNGIVAYHIHSLDSWATRPAQIQVPHAKRVPAVKQKTGRPLLPQFSDGLGSIFTQMPVKIAGMEYLELVHNEKFGA